VKQNINVGIFYSQEKIARIFTYFYFKTCIFIF